jgi:hypothetical protein
VEAAIGQARALLDNAPAASVDEEGSLGAVDVERQREIEARSARARDLCDRSQMLSPASPLPTILKARSARPPRAARCARPRVQPSPSPLGAPTPHRAAPREMHFVKRLSARGGAAGEGADARGAPPPSPRTNRTRRVPHPVLIGHAACRGCTPKRWPSALRPARPRAARARAWRRRGPGVHRRGGWAGCRWHRSCAPPPSY